MTFNVIDDSTKRVDVALTQYPEISFPGPYPLADLGIAGRKVRKLKGIVLT